MTLDNGNLDSSSFLIEGTAYIDFSKIMELDFITAAILSGRKMGKTYGFWKWYAEDTFPDYETLMNGEPKNIFGSIVGKTNEITTSDMLAPWGDWLNKMLPDDYDFDFSVHNRLCYLNIFTEDHKGKRYNVKQHKIGVYGALSQVNTLRRLGNQGITILLIEECNPERSDHPFVGNDISKLSSAITSAVRVADGVRIIALGNQQLYPSIPLKYLQFDEENLGLHNRQLRLMINRPKLDNSNNFLSLVSSTDEYDSFARTIIHDVATLKNEPEYYIKLFNRKPDLFITTSRSITIIGWFTTYNDKKAMFVTSQISDNYLEIAKEVQCYELSPFEEERTRFKDQVAYLQKMYYQGQIVLGKGDRETYYGLAQIGCIAESKVKTIIKNM